MAELLPGDILLIEGTNPLDRLIQWATISPYSHAALVGDGCLIEALYRRGVVRSPICKYSQVRKFHGRVPRVAPADLTNAIAWAGLWVGRTYGWREALDSGARDLLHVPLRPRVFGHVDCSGLVAAAYLGPGRCALTRAIMPTPADLWASELIEEVTQ